MLTRTRWKIGALLGMAALVNYFLRVNISIAGDAIMRELRLSQTQLGTAFSAFLLGYTVFQIPGGLLADRFGARRVIAVAAAVWGALSVLTGLVETLSALIVVRLLLGISQAPMFPASGRMVANWFPSGERAAGNALAIAGVSLGACLVPPVVSWMVARSGWQSSFMMSGALSLPLVAAWSIYVRDQPSLHPGVNDEELRWIATTGADPALVEGDPPGFWAQLRAPQLLRLTLSYAFSGYVAYVFVFWFFLYLVQERHLGKSESVLLTALPWALATGTTFGAGILSDRLVRSRFGPRWGRRLVPMACQIGAAVFLAIGARVESQYAAAGALAVCTSLIMGVEGPYWATAGQLSAKRAGVSGGILNTGGNLGGVLAPTLTPLIAAHFGWARALDVTAVIAVAAAMLWLSIDPTETDCRFKEGIA